MAWLLPVEEIQGRCVVAGLDVATIRYVPLHDEVIISFGLRGFVKFDSEVFRHDGWRALLDHELGLFKAGKP